MPSKNKVNKDNSKVNDVNNTNIINTNYEIIPPKMDFVFKHIGVSILV